MKYIFYINKYIGLGQSRLSIIDIKGGKQPISNEDNTLWLIYNGEIYNYIELREHLKKLGHKFSTKSDTEVIIHSYEEYGFDCLHYFNGQFAFALWDAKKEILFLARDRVGIRPLYFSLMNNETFLFGSEIKSIFKYPQIPREIDPVGVDQIFTYWVNIPPRTVFKGINELPPGHYAVVNKNGVSIREYWDLKFPKTNEYKNFPLSYYTSRLEELIYDAITLRLRSDVPVASYLSGGIDSSIISALIKKYHNNNLITFSISFADKNYDEREYQQQMVNYLNTDHKSIEVDYESIGEIFPDVVWFAEKPLIRSAPGPLFRLSKLVNDNNIKVVLTGEGADEIFGGYNIFKEDKVRRFWAKYPESTCRPLLLSRLYPYINKNGKSQNKFWQNFFKKGLLDTENPFYSHLIRWNNTSMIKQFFSETFRSKINHENSQYELEAYVNPDIRKWHPLCRAQYLEMKLFMAGYLLSSQGDRMMMGNSVEGRFPYLDHRVIEFASQIPPFYKIRGLNEKYILKKTYENFIPQKILYRQKQPYRSPISKCFFNESTPSLIKYLISSETIKKYGYFDQEKVNFLLKKSKRQFDSVNLSAREEMALIAIISQQLLHYYFVENFS